MSNSSVKRTKASLPDRRPTGFDHAVANPAAAEARSHTRSMSPPRPVMHGLWWLHKAIRRLSGGRLGTSTAHGDGMGTLFLHTIGRRTGRPRVNGLFYVTDGTNIAVAASNAGADVDPAWLRNLRERPDAEVEIGGNARPVRARTATDEESARAWAKLDQANPEYVHYRAEAHRPIPLLILEPR